MKAEDVLVVLAALERAGVWTSIEGGWGVDALLGHQTREHRDLDLAVARDDCDRARNALSPLGFEHDVRASPGFPARLVVVDRRGREVDFHPLLFDERGNGWQELPGGGWGLHDVDQLRRAGTINGRGVTCIGPQLQLRFHLPLPPERG